MKANKIATFLLGVGLFFSPVSGFAQEDENNYAYEETEQFDQADGSGYYDEQVADAANSKCLVDGKDVTSMGGPVVVEYDGKQYNLCSMDCVDKMEEDPDKYVANLDQ